MDLFCEKDEVQAFAAFISVLFSLNFSVFRDACVDG
jgi:hypothetical protein